MISRDHNSVALNDSWVEVISAVCLQNGFKSDLLCPGLALAAPAGMPKEEEQRVWRDESGMPSGGWDGGNSGSISGLQKACVQGTQEGPPEPQRKSPNPR